MKNRIIKFSWTLFCVIGLISLIKAQNISYEIRVPKGHKNLSVSSVNYVAITVEGKEVEELIVEIEEEFGRISIIKPGLYKVYPASKGNCELIIKNKSNKKFLGKLKIPVFLPLEYQGYWGENKITEEKIRHITMEQFQNAKIFRVKDIYHEGVEVTITQFVISYVSKGVVVEMKCNSEEIYEKFRISIGENWGQIGKITLHSIRGVTKEGKKVFVPSFVMQTIQ